MPLQTAPQIILSPTGRSECGRIKDEGGIRTQWHHVIDILPTVLEAVKVAAPTEVEGIKQRPIEGVSMCYTFGQPASASARRTQYFELQSRNLSRRLDCCDNACCCAVVYDNTERGRITGYNWQLYHVAQDFSESKDLAASMPDKLAELQKLFYEEAAKYRVLPLDNDRVMRLNPANRPSLSPGRTSFTYSPEASGFRRGSTRYREQVMEYYREAGYPQKWVGRCHRNTRWVV